MGRAGQTGSRSAARQPADNRVINEAVRRVKHQAKVDPQFVPPADDASAILASRIFGDRQTPQSIAGGSSGGTAVDDANQVVASRVFAQRLDPPPSTSSATPHTLTFGTHLTATDASYDTTASKTIATDATDANVSGAIVARDGSGDIAVTKVTGDVDAAIVNVSNKVVMGAGNDIFLGNSLNATVLTIVGYVTVKDHGGSIVKLAVVN